MSPCSPPEKNALVWPPAHLEELDIRTHLGVSVLPALALSGVLALVIPLAASGAPVTKAVSDPAGDVAYAPIDGFTPLGPGTWADVLHATYTVAKGDNVTVTIRTADLPEGGGQAGMWGVDGRVVLPGGAKRSFNAWVTSAGEDYAGVGSKTCRSSASISPGTNTVVVKIDFSPCVRGAAKVRLRAKGTVKGSKTVGPDTYYQAIYTDVTVRKNIRVR